MPTYPKLAGNIEGTITNAIARIPTPSKQISLNLLVNAKGHGIHGTSHKPRKDTNNSFSDTAITIRVERKNFSIHIHVFPAASVETGPPSSVPLADPGPTVVGRYFLNPDSKSDSQTCKVMPKDAANEVLTAQSKAQNQHRRRRAPWPRPRCRPSCSFRAHSRGR